MFVPLLAIYVAIFPHGHPVHRVVAQAPTPAPSAAAAPIATASPGLIAVPSSTQGLVLPPVPAVAPGFNAPSVALPSGDIAGTSGPFVGLSLQSAIGMALSHNTNLAVSQSNRRIAGYQIVAAKGAYDLNFAVSPSYSYGKTPAISSFQTGPGGTPVSQIALGSSAGISGITGTGGHFQASTSAQRVDNNSAFNSYEPYYQTALALQFTQPLLRGAAIDGPRRQLQLARINADLTNDQALQSASDTLDGVLVAYYNLVAAWKNVAIQEDALRQAKAQSESNARLVKSGVAAPVDVVDSDTQVNEFQDDVYSAIANVASLQNTLKSLILSDPADPIWTANLVPTSPISMIVPEPTVDAVVAAALKYRPEMASLRENVRAQGVNVAYAKDQTRPQIDLNLGVVSNGFAGNATNPLNNPIAGITTSEISAINQLIARSNANNPGLPALQMISGAALNAPLTPGSVGGLGQSYATALQGKYPQYTLSATIGFPLTNRTARADYASERERAQQLEIQEVGLIQRIQAESRNAVQQYRSARSRLIAATAARTAAETVAASEVRKFRAGQSTTFLVLQRQVRLATERGRELQAQSDVQKALVELDRVSGAILTNNAVDAGAIGQGVVVKGGASR